MFIGFIIFNTTGLISEFRGNDWFGEICIGSQNICINVSEFLSPNQTFKCWYIFTNILGLPEIFPNRFLRWKSEIEPVVLIIMSPINRQTFYAPYKGRSEIFREFVVSLKNSNPQKFLFSFTHYTREPKSPKEQKLSSKNEFSHRLNIGYPVNIEPLYQVRIPCKWI